MRCRLFIHGFLIAGLMMPALVTASEGAGSASILFMDELGSGRDDVASTSLELHPPQGRERSASRPDHQARVSRLPAVPTDNAPAGDLSERNFIDGRSGDERDEDQRDQGDFDQPQPGDEWDEENERRPTGNSAGDDDGETLEDAAATVRAIAFDKIFADLELLRQKASPGDVSTSSACCPRDPYYGFATTTEFTWVPSNLAHKTLYFDDDPLERYGETCFPLLQPAISAGEFAKDLLTAPIRGVFDGPCKCHFVAGRPRIGSCVCHLKERIVPAHRR